MKYMEEQDFSEVITGSDFRRMIAGAYSEFILEYENINNMNQADGRTFYTGMPGTDILREQLLFHWRSLPMVVSEDWPSGCLMRQY